jgi:hypothetical protein
MEAKLPKNVQLLKIIAASLKMLTPMEEAQFPEKVLLLTVAVP